MKPSAVVPPVAILGSRGHVDHRHLAEVLSRRASEPIIERQIAPAYWGAEEEARQEHRVMRWLVETIALLLVTGAVLFVVHGLTGLP
ncbi:MAG: hypothetical protein PHS14_20925 [Elusimicrobia bacterium]|nr:hypothetical protein [Elusimicrobiota bacterium]